MTIEIKEKGTRQFYKEVLNVISQYRQLLYRPADKLRDNFTRYILLSLAMAFICAIFLFGGIKGSFTIMNTITMIFAGLAAAATVVYLARMYKALNDYLADERASVVTLDENGVEIAKDGAAGVRLDWDNVAFVRSFSESTCFFAGDLSGTILAVNNDYRKEILDFIKDNGIEVRVIK